MNMEQRYKETFDEIKLSEAKIAEMEVTMRNDNCTKRKLPVKKLVVVIATITLIFVSGVVAVAATTKKDDIYNYVKALLLSDERIDEATMSDEEMDAMREVIIDEVLENAAKEESSTDTGEIPEYLKNDKPIVYDPSAKRMADMTDDELYDKLIELGLYLEGWAEYENVKELVVRKARYTLETGYEDGANFTENTELALRIRTIVIEYEGMEDLYLYEPRYYVYLDVFYDFRHPYS